MEKRIRIKGTRRGSAALDTATLNLADVVDNLLFKIGSKGCGASRCHLQPFWKFCERPYPHPFPADSGPNTFPRGCYQNTLQGKTLPPRPDITSTTHPPPSPQCLPHLLPNQALPLPPLLRLARTRPAALRARSQRPKHALRLGYLAVCAL